jgi:hypothetical protein
MTEAIDFDKYKIKIPKGPKPINNRHYKRMLRKLRRELPHLNG